MPLGWHVSVYRQQTDGSTPATFGSPQGARLAVWQTALGGLDWLKELVSQGKAISLGGHGYPVEYTAMADQILPRIRGVPPGAKTVWSADPGDIIGRDWAGGTTHDIAAMDACRPDEWLLIQAWDES